MGAESRKEQWQSIEGLAAEAKARAEEMVARRSKELMAESRVQLLVDYLCADDLTRADALRVLSVALDEYGAGVPEGAIYSQGVRADAKFWADLAAPTELEAYCAAALAQIESHPMGDRMAKRLIVAAWEALAPASRIAFLARVDPSGKFRGGK